jgi:UDP-glucose 4-epimerase
VRAIVTGGAGFIGSHVVDALVASGDEVVVVDSLVHGKEDNVPAGAELHVRDIRTPLDDLFEAARPETVFHLAAQADVRVSVERPDHDADVNVLGTIRVLEAARAHGTRIVFSSTGGAIYGEVDRPAPEDAPRMPVAPYGTAKLAAEEYVATYNRLHGTSHVVVRYANVYGPRQESNLEGGVVSIFMRLLAAGETPQIYGDGTQTRDFVYVDDVAAATIKALHADGGVFNVGTGVETSVNHLYEAVRRVADVDRRAEHAPPRAGELSRSVLDIGLARRELRWEPEHDLESGLAETWKWIAAG